jgi:hypothetical protein
MELPFKFFCWVKFRSELSASLVFCSCFLKDFSRFVILREEFKFWDCVLLIISWALAIAFAVDAVILVASNDLRLAFRLSAAVASLSFSL